MEPPTGFETAHPMLSQDGSRAGFTGVSLGGALPYGVLDSARRVYGLRHRAPHRPCDCGFHRVHDRTAAEAMLCTAENRTAVLLEVPLGPYLRFELGFRYARQRVRTATVGPCACGSVAVAPADAGWGKAGWRALAASRAGRVRGRPSVSLATFARLGGDGLRVRAQGGAAPSGGDLPEGLGVSELIAEAALLRARLDWFPDPAGPVWRARGPTGVAPTRRARAPDTGSGGSVGYSKHPETRGGGAL